MRIRKKDKVVKAVKENVKKVDLSKQKEPKEVSKPKETKQQIVSNN